VVVAVALAGVILFGHGRGHESGYDYDHPTSLP
jgi:hypothetical protein